MTLIPSGFDSWSSYFKFVGAKEFYDVQQQHMFLYPKTMSEKIGNGLAIPSLGFADHSLKNIRNPLMILTLTGVAVVAVTILFYPDQVIQKLGIIAPLALRFKPWMLKLALFGMIEATLLGIGIRTIGRLNPQGDLWQAWTAKKIIPIAIGTQVVIHPYEPIYFP